jgi:hypothetical protein
MAIFGDPHISRFGVPLILFCAFAQFHVRFGDSSDEMVDEEVI